MLGLKLESSVSSLNWLLALSTHTSQFSELHLTLHPTYSSRVTDWIDGHVKLGLYNGLHPIASSLHTRTAQSHQVIPAGLQSLYCHTLSLSNLYLFFNNFYFGIINL